MSWLLTQKQSDFFWLDCRYPAFVGGFGCMHGSTKIWTENGLKCISDISPGERVLSWNEKDQKCVLSPTSGAFPKGKDYLHRVVTQHGEFESSGHHHSLNAHGQYQSVSQLGVHDGLCQLNSSLLQTISEFDLRLLFEDEGHYTQKDVDCLVHYGVSARQYGQQLLQGEDTGQRCPGHKDVLVGQTSQQSSAFPVTLSCVGISAVSVKEVKEVYWDMQVLNTNNYICEHGFIHHNSGKTQTLLARAIRDKFMWPTSTIALYEPTYDLARLILIPRLLELLDTAKVKYLHHKSENVVYLKNRGKFIIRTLDKPNRIVGYEAFRSHVDELDTLRMRQAEAVWIKICARNRQKVPGGGTNQVCAYTTPEGFNFVYKNWCKSPTPRHKYIVAPTSSNKEHLPDDYIEGLMDQYPPNLVDAYLGGLFTNLTMGTVYGNFSRVLNSSTVALAGPEPLHIGMDFNVSRGCAIVHVLRDGLPVAVDEIVNSYDTPATIRIMKDRYDGFPVTVYPDASGKNRKSQNASQTDLQLLKDAGFRVKTITTNPQIKDRVQSMNAMFLNAQGERRYKVNIAACPFYTDSLEQQAYDANGFPEKGAGKGDDLNDSGGYYIVNMFPIVRRKLDTVRLMGL